MNGQINQLINLMITMAVLKMGVGIVEPIMLQVIPSKLAWVKKYLPEYKEILEDWNNLKPHKFVENITILRCPATFNPSAQGDFAFTKSYVYKDGVLTKGPGYSYDSMLAGGVNPYEHTVDVPKGVRVWVTTYDGQWGGFWSRVEVYIHATDLLEPGKEAAPPRKGLFAGKRQAVPVIDTTTGRVYHSKAACGKALAEEAGTVPTDHFAWYKLLEKFPNRFRDASDTEIADAKTKGVYTQEVWYV